MSSHGSVSPSTCPARTLRFRWADPRAGHLQISSRRSTPAARQTRMEHRMNDAAEDAMICIWCGGDFAKLSIEHAIPEALACPPDLILKNVACAPCNNGFSKVDRALVRQFETISVMYGVPRKRGRKPTIDGWSALASSNGAEGPEIHVNAGPGIIGESWVCSWRRS